MPITVSDLKFGEIDAKNEEFQQARYGSAVFANAFQVPPRVDVDDLMLGARFFISGQKGCGKTALLLHVRRLLSEQGAATHTILFKSGLSEDERQLISAGTGFEVITTGDQISIQYDYVTNWLWLIYRNLLRMIDESQVMEGADLVADLKKIMGVQDVVRVSTFSDLSIKKVKLSAKAGVKASVANAELAGELEFVKRESEERTHLELIALCERFISRIKVKPKGRSLLFFDELELFWSRPDQKQRDLYLIRDLLQAVARVNRVVGLSSATFVVYASIRSEVLEEVNRVGPEIARDVSDFGTVVDWNVKGSAEKQPILDIVEAKIQASEIEQNNLPSTHVWDVYFPENVHGKSAREHLLDVSMFKPRLIVSRLNLAKAYDPQAEFISFEAFDETSTTFSNSVWREVEEELLVNYTPDQVRNLKSLLSGFRIEFTVEEFEGRINQLSMYQPSVRQGFRTRGDVTAVMISLYRIGALGNRFMTRTKGKIETRDRWAFREYSEPAIDEAFVVHESLRKAFQLGFD